MLISPVTGQQSPDRERALHEEAPNLTEPGG
jgi:hypothetical protein